MKTPSPQIAERELENSTACTGKRPTVDSTAGLLAFLEDPDQEDDDQNDQKNGPQTDIHRLSPFRFRNVIFSAHQGGKPQVNQEESSNECRLVNMSERLLLRLVFLVVLVVALAGAVVQLGAGRRPVLLGGSAV
jgi:hypothetical protein